MTAKETLIWNTIAPSTDCFWVLSPSTGQWHQLTPSGESPKPRAFAGFTTMGRSLYVFAGLGDNKKKWNDLWKYNLDTASWTVLPIHGPGGRFGISLIAMNGGVFVVGGQF